MGGRVFRVGDKVTQLRNNYDAVDQRFHASLGGASTRRSPRSSAPCAHPMERTRVAVWRLPLLMRFAIRRVQ